MSRAPEFSQEGIGRGLRMLQGMTMSKAVHIPASALGKFDLGDLCPLESCIGPSGYSTSRYEAASRRTTRYGESMEGTQTLVSEDARDGVGTV